MKAMILTRCPVREKDRAFINKSNMLKIAVNGCDFQANYRLFYDSFHWKKYLKYTEILYTRSIEAKNIKDQSKFVFFDDAEYPNSQNKKDLYMAHSSLIPSIDLAIKLGAKDILLIANNNVDNISFLKHIFEPAMNKTIELFKPHASIYQFSNGNFMLPVKNLEKFCLTL